MAEKPLICQMGHLIEYIAAVPECRVQTWLATLSGFALVTCDATRGWEGKLPGGEGFWAYSIDRATSFVLCAKYTWLFNGDPTTLDLVRRFEAEFWRHVGPVPLLRLSELLRSEWEVETGREWWEHPAPVDAAIAWLANQEPTHWQLLSPPATPTPTA